MDGMYLEGIGYREQELQVAKGKNFASEDATGVPYVSFAGGTHIFIKGVGLNFAPEKNTIKLKCVEIAGDEFTAPPLTEEDQFNSHAQLGHIAYRIPAVTELFDGVPASQFDHFDTLTFYLKIHAKTDFINDAILDCRNVG